MSVDLSSVQSLHPLIHWSLHQQPLIYTYLSKPNYLPPYYIKPPTHPSGSQPTSQPANESANQSVSQPISQSTHPSVRPSINTQY